MVVLPSTSRRNCRRGSVERVKLGSTSVGKARVTSRGEPSRTFLSGLEPPVLRIDGGFILHGFVADQESFSGGFPPSSLVPMHKILSGKRS